MSLFARSYLHRYPLTAKEDQTVKWKAAVAEAMSLTLPMVLTCGVALAQEAMSANYEEIAHRIVTTSAHVKFGDKVVISGGKHVIPLIEALAMEVDNQGGRVVMLLNSERVMHNYYANVPEQYLGDPGLFTDLIKAADVYISLPGIEDPKTVFQGVPDSRIAKASAAGEIVRKALNQSKIREIDVQVPNQRDAEYAHMDYAAYQKMQWDAINADYQQIAQKGNQLKDLLAHSKVVKITSPSGTSFTLSVGGRPIFVDAGMVNPPSATGTPFLARTATLPGGAVSFAPIETSGSGKIMVPKDTCQPYEPLTGASYEFKNGKLINFKAENNGRCFESMLAAGSGAKDMLGSVTIGLNPALKVIEDTADYRPPNASGMVFVGLGTNDLLGGNNKTDSGWLIPVSKATVEVDGKIVIKDGELR